MKYTLAFLLISTSIQAQYAGGTGDGYESLVIINPRSDLTMGGTEDGYDIETWDGTEDCTTYHSNEWNGGDGSWLDPEKWSLNMVPNGCHDVTHTSLGGSINLSHGIGLAHSVNTNYDITIAEDSRLEINLQGSTLNGIKVNGNAHLRNYGYISIKDGVDHYGALDIRGDGTVHNYRTLEIVNHSGFQSRGINLQAGTHLINYDSGTITIDNVVDGSSIYNSGLVENQGMIDIIDSDDEHSIFNSASFSEFLNEGSLIIENIKDNGVGIYTNVGSQFHHSGYILLKRG